MDESNEKFLYKRVNFERRPPAGTANVEFDLGLMHTLMERLGDPHTRYPVVHVGGTKGKGSTAAMISEIARASGYRVGVYSSPHLGCLTERFCVDRIAISKQELSRLIDRARPIVDELDQEFEQGLQRRAATFFEITTALAFCYFLDQAVDLAVIEVGLGGRLDSTNVCRPIVSVITNVGFDHMNLLGNRLEQIAFEKAGIIKSGIPVVSGWMPDEAAAIIEAETRRNQSLGIRAGQEYGHRQNGDSPHWEFWMNVSSGEPVDSQREDSAKAIHFESELVNRPTLNELQTNTTSEHSTAAVESVILEPAMQGKHQVDNACIAAATATVLQMQGWRIGADDIRGGIRHTKLAGRFERHPNHCSVIFDIAHNVPSFEALSKTLDDVDQSSLRLGVVGISRDKDIDGICRCLIQMFDKVIITHSANSPRSAPLEQVQKAITAQLQLQPQARLQADQVITCQTPADAVEQVTALSFDGMQIYTGSVFLVAEIRELMGLSTTWSAQQLDPCSKP